MSRGSRRWFALFERGDIQEAMLEMNITVFHFYTSALQYGGLPLITPLNETFPPNFNTHRTELRYISLRTKDQAIIFQRLDPLPGSWFAAVFLGDHVDKKIAQKVI